MMRVIRGPVAHDSVTYLISCVPGIHADHLAGARAIDMTFNRANAAADGAAGTIRFRRGFMLGNGTRAGKACHSTGVWRQGWANICDALIATVPS